MVWIVICVMAGKSFSITLTLIELLNVYNLNVRKVNALIFILRSRKEWLKMRLLTEPLDMLPEIALQKEHSNQRPNKVLFQETRLKFKQLLTQETKIIWIITHSQQKLKFILRILNNKAQKCNKEAIFLINLLSNLKIKMKTRTYKFKIK